MIASARGRTIIDRMLGAALLEPEVYQEATLAPSIRTQAMLVVVATSIAAGIGSLDGGLSGLVAGTLMAFVGWIAFAIGAYWLAIKQFNVQRTYNNLTATLRVLGLASAPRLFLALTFVPGIGFLLGLAVHSWVLIAAVFALKQALDMETRPAIISAAGGCLPMLALWVLVSFLT